MLQESEHSITDREGTSYRVEFLIDRIWSAYVRRDGIQAGYVHCVDEAPC